MPDRTTVSLVLNNLPDVHQGATRAARRYGYHILFHGRFARHRHPLRGCGQVQGAKTAAEHLLWLGHRRIWMMTNAPLAYIASCQRLEDTAALGAAGVPYDEELVRYGNFDEESGRQAMEALVSLGERPRRFHPPDTLPPPTVHVPAFGLGWSAAELLIRTIEGDLPNETQLHLETELVIRESCGANAVYGKEVRREETKYSPASNSSVPIIPKIQGGKRCLGVSV